MQMKLLLQLSTMMMTKVMMKMMMMKRMKRKVLCGSRLVRMVSCLRINEWR